MYLRALFGNLSLLLAIDLTSTNAHAQPTSVLGVDCSSIAALGIDKQMNMRAALIRIGCGVEMPGEPGSVKPGVGAPLPSPVNVNTITGLEIFPHVTQSESMVWSSDGQTIVVNYNDSNTAPANYSGVSVSTDGGNTFTRILPAPFATGHGTNFGDPIVVFNAELNKWFAGDLATGCGGQGIGLWASDDGLTWTVGACAHSGGNDDRESMWVDNNFSSPFYGRMYVSWNDFASGQRIFVSHSDNGTQWSAPVPLSSVSPFIRNVQLTGSPEDGTVFVAGMDEGGGGLNNRTNLIYRSPDGGDTWTQITMGIPFAPPGEPGCGYFARISPIWRHMGWGQPGVGPGGVVHYAYAGRGANLFDVGDIYYVQSLDNGTTWSAPIILNSDQAAGGNLAQWMPSLSVTASGTVRVSWYDRRNSTDGWNYEVWGIESVDNGQTWGADVPISDTLIPQPEQPDSNVQSCYAGDYNYVTAFGETSYVTWTDGRVPIQGHFQQDVFFGRIPFPGNVLKVR
jgi:hypothetical protein